MPFDWAQDKPFDWAQDKPFDTAQGKQSMEQRANRQEKNGTPFDGAQDKQMNADFWRLSQSPQRTQRAVSRGGWSCLFAASTRPSAPFSVPLAAVKPLPVRASLAALGAPASLARAGKSVQSAEKMLPCGSRAADLVYFFSDCDGTCPARWRP
jgi:hypothetical protein